MMLRRFLIFLVAIWMGLLGTWAKGVWSASDVPVPYLKDSTQYVSDPDGYVSRELKDSANYYLRRLNLECGVQNLLVIVGHVAQQDAFRMAQDLGNKYGIGYKGSRRGLVVVIAVEDRKYFIAPGMGLEGELTDVDCDDIARACIVNYMRQGKPGEAVASVSRAIYNKVKSGRTGIPDVDDDSEEEDWALIVLCLALCFCVPIYMLVRYVLERMGIVRKRPKARISRRRRDDDDWMPPFFMGGGGGYSGGGSGGGSFGGGSFGGGGSGGSW